MLEVKGLDASRNFSIVLGKGTIDGPEVGSVFAPRKLQPDLKEEFVELRVELHPEEGHLCFFIYNRTLIDLDL